MGFFDKIFGSHTDRELKKLYPIADAIEKLDDEYSKLSDDELRAKTDEFKARLAQGETLDDILVEAFATVREAAWRVLGLKPFRVQLIGGIVLHQGRIAEMRTGEGKTLVAVLPAYLNALAGKGVHIVTVNDYLARRDSEWMGKVHRFLGLEVGLIVHGLSSDQRRKAYNADITYGTNNELGFDYLRDNMAIYKEHMVQRGHAFAIVDEVDSILIDEARTPLIISGQGEESSDLYERVNEFAARLKKKVVVSVNEKEEEDENLDADYVVDEKARTVTLTARGTRKAEQHFGIENLSDIENSTLSHHINQAIRAYGIMKKDIDYVVKDGEVIIVDEFTGRLMLGRRYSEGLHQAIEAKERVKVEDEDRTLATITFQNFFRLYGKLSGMTGTALTEAEEFEAIYKLDIVEIPTNKPLARIDHNDVLCKDEMSKYRTVIEQIKQCHAKGQPVLVGTVSIEKSEALSALLRREGVQHNVLNAKNHEREAEIVAQAGKLFAVTIATNMAGRGTDIKLGGNDEFLAKRDLKKAEFPDEVIAEAVGHADTNNEEILKARALYNERMEVYRAEIAQEAEKVRAAGGLFIIGTERHDSRRIDNQLRGRSGRQGDPGESRFYVAVTDDIMRLFGAERVVNLLGKTMEENRPIDTKIMSTGFEQAQKNVESRNFLSRKSVLEYDDVMNIQRGTIYDERRRVLDGEDIKDNVKTMIRDYVFGHVAEILEGRSYPESRDELQLMLSPFQQLFLLPEDITPEKYPLESLTLDKLTSLILERADAAYEMREQYFGIHPDTGKPVMREIERVVVLGVVDQYWMEHIDAMQELRRGIALRSFGNTKPIDAYKEDGFAMFEEMIEGIKREVARRIYTVQVNFNTELKRKAVAKVKGANVGGERVKKQPVRKEKKVGRNELCPCGSGKKYKKCCGMYEN